MGLLSVFPTKVLEEEKDIMVNLVMNFLSM